MNKLILLISFIALLAAQTCDTDFVTCRNGCINVADVDICETAVGGNCTKCNSTYTHVFLDESTGICQHCVAYDSLCSECKYNTQNTNKFECTKCENATMKLVNGTCVIHDENCVTRSDSKVDCEVCRTSYYRPDVEKCILYENCENCYSHSNVCDYQTCQHECALNKAGDSCIPVTNGISMEEIQSCSRYNFNTEGKKVIEQELPDESNSTIKRCTMVYDYQPCITSECCNLFCLSTETACLLNTTESFKCEACSSDPSVYTTRGECTNYCNYKFLEYKDSESNPTKCVSQCPTAQDELNNLTDVGCVACGNQVYTYVAEKSKSAVCLASCPLDYYDLDQLSCHKCGYQFINSKCFKDCAELEKDAVSVATISSTMCPLTCNFVVMNEQCVAHDCEISDSKKLGNLASCETQCQKKWVIFNDDSENCVDDCAEKDVNGVSCSGKCGRYSVFTSSSDTTLKCDAQCPTDPTLSADQATCNKCKFCWDGSKCQNASSVHDNCTQCTIGNVCSMCKEGNYVNNKGVCAIDVDSNEFCETEKESKYFCLKCREDRNINAEIRKDNCNTCPEIIVPPTPSSLNEHSSSGSSELVFIGFAIFALLLL